MTGLGMDGSWCKQASRVWVLWVWLQTRVGQVWGCGQAEWPTYSCGLRPWWSSELMEGRVELGMGVQGIGAPPCFFVHRVLVAF